MQKNLILQLMVVTLFGLGQTIPLDESQYIVKNIHYDYDLVSGKVNKVSYQEGETDQLQHRYEYDGDNRITAVYTSTEGINWTKEATYEYYAHGPLAKTELGEQKVETQNYAYTLQGWAKGVKGQNFSYALGYNNKDYKAISASSYGGENVGLKATPIATVTGGTTQNPTSTTQNLYNGNIATWASLNTKINGTTAWTQQFTYDQLSRIKSGTTLSGGDNYKNTYSYDPNGNISTLSRWDKSGAQIDQFSYNYESKGTGYLANTNRLRSVDDGINTTLGSALSTEDLEDQNIDNYQYDDLGNLNYDRQEEIDRIEWTVYGKVRAVYRKPNSSKANLSYEYDAVGKRIAKTLIKGTDVTKTYYIRDAGGNVMSTYQTNITNSLAIQEYYVYGNGRLAVLDKKGRSYELTDHLGNVRAVVSENKAVSSATDYYPFGMPAEQYEPSSGYRYGFNGQEREKEMNSSTTSAEYWMYDGRLARRWNVDPKPNPSISNYACFANNPIINCDPNGDTLKVVGAAPEDEIAFKATLDYMKQNSEEANKIITALEMSPTTHTIYLSPNPECMGKYERFIRNTLAIATDYESTISALRNQIKPNLEEGYKAQLLLTIDELQKMQELKVPIQLVSEANSSGDKVIGNTTITIWQNTGADGKVDFSKLDYGAFNGKGTVSRMYLQFYSINCIGNIAHELKHMFENDKGMIDGLSFLGGHNQIVELSASITSNNICTEIISNTCSSSYMNIPIHPNAYPWFYTGDVGDYCEFESDMFQMGNTSGSPFNNVPNGR